MLKRLLLLNLLLGLSLLLSGAALPGGLAGLDADDVYGAWSVSREDIPELAVYLAACKRNYADNENRLPPAAIDGDELALLDGTSRYSTIGIRLTNQSAFRLEWKMQVATLDGKAKNLVVDTIKNELPENAELNIYSGEDKLFTLREKSGSFAAAPGEYSIVAELSMRENVECTYTLLPGWNLINIPLAAVTDAGGLFNYQVMDWKRKSVAGAESLQAGNCYWVRNAGNENAEITVTGNAYQRTQAALGQADSSWKCVGVIAFFNTASNSLDAGNITVKGWTWDAAKQAFVPVAEKAQLTKAYILK